MEHEKIINLLIKTDNSSPENEALPMVNQTEIMMYEKKLSIMHKY